MTPDVLLFMFLQNLLKALPYLLVTGISVGLVSWSPLGRAVLEYLRERKRNMALTQEMLEELSGLRHALGEVTERLDATERNLNMARERGELKQGSASPPTPSSDSPRPITPH